MNKLLIKIFSYFFILSLLSCNYDNRVVKKMNFDMQLGTYKLDLKKTNLGIYDIDSLLYKKLQITFKRDSTFPTSLVSK